MEALPRSEAAQAIHLPSGDQAGENSGPGVSVIRRVSPESITTAKKSLLALLSQSPVRLLTKAISLLSGDQLRE